MTSPHGFRIHPRPAHTVSASLMERYRNFRSPISAMR